MNFIKGDHCDQEYNKLTQLQKYIKKSENKEQNYFER